jgi:hypothetical protein
MNDINPTPGKSRLTISAAEIRLDPARLAEFESAYRCGTHQAFAMACDLAYDAKTLAEARRMLCRAERLAGKLRFQQKKQGKGYLLDYMRSKLFAGRGVSR